MRGTGRPPAAACRACRATLTQSVSPSAPSIRLLQTDDWSELFLILPARSVPATWLVFRTNVEIPVQECVAHRPPALSPTISPAVAVTPAMRETPSLSVTRRQHVRFTSSHKVVSQSKSKPLRRSTLFYIPPHSNPPETLPCPSVGPY